VGACVSEEGGQVGNGGGRRVPLKVVRRASTGQGGGGGGQAVWAGRKKSCKDPAMPVP